MVHVSTIGKAMAFLNSYPVAILSFSVTRSMPRRYQGSIIETQTEWREPFPPVSRNKPHRFIKDGQMTRASGLGDKVDAVELALASSGMPSASSLSELEGDNMRDQSGSNLVVKRNCA